MSGQDENMSEIEVKRLELQEKLHLIKQQQAQRIANEELFKQKCDAEQKLIQATIKKAEDMNAEPPRANNNSNAGGQNENNNSNTILRTEDSVVAKQDTATIADNIKNVLLAGRKGLAALCSMTIPDPANPSTNIEVSVPKVILATLHEYYSSPLPRGDPNAMTALIRLTNGLSSKSSDSMVATTANFIKAASDLEGQPLATYLETESKYIYDDISYRANIIRVITQATVILTTHNIAFETLYFAKDKLLSFPAKSWYIIHASVESVVQAYVTKQKTEFDKISPPLKTSDRYKLALTCGDDTPPAKNTSYAASSYQPVQLPYRNPTTHPAYGHHEPVRRQRTPPAGPPKPAGKFSKHTHGTKFSGTVPKPTLGSTPAEKARMEKKRAESQNGTFCEACYFRFSNQLHNHRTANCPYFNATAPYNNKL